VTVLQTILKKGVFKTDESVGEILEIALVNPETSTKIEIQDQEEGAITFSLPL
jgi:hypothetical protein